MTTSSFYCYRLYQFHLRTSSFCCTGLTISYDTLLSKLISFNYNLFPPATGHIRATSDNLSCNIFLPWMLQLNFTLCTVFTASFLSSYSTSSPVTVHPSSQLLVVTSSSRLSLQPRPSSQPSSVHCPQGASSFFTIKSLTL